MDEEGGSKQVWDGSKGMLSLFAIPNRFGLFNLLPINLRDWQFAEKVIFRRLLKNAPASAEAATRRQADAS